MMIELTPRANARWMRIKHLCEEATILASSTANRIGAHSRVLLNNPADAPSIKLEIARLQETLSDHQAHADSLTQLLAQLTMWAQTLKYPVVDAPRVKVKLKPDETILSALGDVRREIAELDSELRSVQRASPTVEEQKAACDRWLASLPAQARPRVKAHKHNFFDVSFNDPTSHTVRSPIAAILYWLEPEAMRNRLHQELENLPTPTLVLSAEKKAERIAEIRSDALKAERYESALIEYGEEQGQRIVIRPFMSPLALLGLAFKEQESQSRAA